MPDADNLHPSKKPYQTMVDSGPESHPAAPSSASCFSSPISPVKAGSPSRQCQQPGDDPTTCSPRRSPATIEQFFGATPETCFLMGSLVSLVPVESALMIDPSGHAGLEGLPDAPGRLCRRDGESSLCAERLHVTFKLNLVSSVWLTKRAVLSPSLATSMSFGANDDRSHKPRERERGRESKRESERESGVHFHLVSARPVFSPRQSHQACASGVRLAASKRLAPGRGGEGRRQLPAAATKDTTDTIHHRHKEHNIKTTKNTKTTKDTIDTKTTKDTTDTKTTKDTTDTTEARCMFLSCPQAYAVHGVSTTIEAPTATAATASAETAGAAAAATAAVANAAAAAADAATAATIILRQEQQQQHQPQQQQQQQHGRRRQQQQQQF